MCLHLLKALALQAQQAVKQYQEAGLPLSECSVASDGFGSWPVYDKQGRLLSYEVPTLLSCSSQVSKKLHGIASERIAVKSDRILNPAC